MQQITINVPDKKVEFFKELVASLGYKVDASSGAPVLTPEQIKLVNKERKRLRDHPEEFVDWSSARKQLKNR